MRLGGDDHDPEDEGEPEDGRDLYETLTEKIGEAPFGTQIQIADVFQRRLMWTELPAALRLLFDDIAQAYLARID